MENLFFCAVFREIFIFSADSIVQMDSYPSRTKEKSPLSLPFILPDNYPFPSTSLPNSGNLLPSISISGVPLQAISNNSGNPFPGAPLPSLSKLTSLPQKRSLDSRNDVQNCSLARVAMEAVIQLQTGDAKSVSNSLLIGDKSEKASKKQKTSADQKEQARAEQQRVASRRYRQKRKLLLEQMENQLKELLERTEGLEKDNHELKSMLNECRAELSQMKSISSKLEGNINQIEKSGSWDESQMQMWKELKDSAVKLNSKIDISSKRIELKVVNPDLPPSPKQKVQE